MRPLLFALAALLLLPSSPAIAQGGRTLPLSLEDAIQRGLSGNAAVLQAATRVEEAAGSKQRRNALYLPHLHIETPFAYQTRNLRAMGISFPGVPAVVGPFTTYDFRLYGDQTLFDLQSYYGIRAGEKEVAARGDDYRDARSRAIRLVAGNYLAAQYAAARVETARSRVRSSQTLERLALDQRAAGVADGLDVLRAQVQLANDRQNLVVAQNGLKQSLLVLARSIGIDLSTELSLTETLRYRPLPRPQIEEAVGLALTERPDYRSLLTQRQSLEEQAKASRARYYPKLVVSGNYGGSGQNIGDIEPSGIIQLNLLMTIFDADRTGERVELESRMRRIEDQIADQKLGVEQDIREALLNLEAADQEVAVAADGLALAQKELAYASDRFKNGVANNVEVVNAQDALARALDNNLDALVRHVESKIALAAALGETEKVYRQFLGIGEEVPRQ
ncbi:TolC family protein [Geomonas sp. Red32]|uniref:TolC family protein n=1 Tax=Geomonas sp. Red32 TaxID=2912856 RepID=UPI00202CB22C|nr:TolC family protein [Geomonas sp. Red32]MCM0082926.1 TolC family protein [Geomonas sp. Red32]